MVFLNAMAANKKTSKDGFCIPAVRACWAMSKRNWGSAKCDTQPSWDILGNVGNLSSATILFILQEWLEKRPLKSGEYALAAAFGPGFSAEFLLLQWT